MNDIISAYSAKESILKETWFIPKLNTAVFRDGNGIPLLRREVHEYYLGEKYKSVGCDSTIDHSCPLCSAWTEEMYRTGTNLGCIQQKIADFGLSDNERDEVLQIFKERAYSKTPFNKQDYTYIVVAVLINYYCEEMMDTDNIPLFDTKLVRMTTNTYNKEFRQKILGSDTGVFLDVTYQDLDSIIDKARSREVSESNIVLSNMAEFEKIVTREFKSLDMIDLIKIKPELGVTSIDRANSIVEGVDAYRRQYINEDYNKLIVELIHGQTNLRNKTW